MDFIGAVNRILVNAFILKGDDDLITSFMDEQHEATVRVARNAFTSELNNLLSVFTVPYERTTGTITTVQGQRTYALPTDFVRFYLNDPFLYLTDGSGQRAVEYGGGEARLRQQDHFYLTQEGYERWWYWHDDVVKSIALYQVPDADGRVWSFEYERDRTVLIETDTVPLQTEQEAQALADMAARRFKYIIEELNVSDLEQDADYVFSRQTLMNLLAHRDPNTRRGFRYRDGSEKISQDRHRVP
jgi:hypothetical protein